MHLLLTKIRNLDLPLDCQIKLFQHPVQPILLYGAEIWGFENIDIIDKVYTDFLKYILHVKKSTPHSMIYGEIGTFPIHIQTKLQMITYWAKLIKGKSNKLSNVMYRVLYTDSIANKYEYKWISFIKNTLDELGLSYIWINNDFPSIVWIKNKVSRSLKDSFMQSWQANIEASSKCLNYKLFKSEHKFENYLTKLPPTLRQIFINFRLCNNRLPIETGRWRDIPRSDRICLLCNKNSIGDEFHYVFDCLYFKQDRIKYLPKYFTKNSNIIKFNELFNIKSHRKLRNVCYFLKKILNTYK